MSWLDDYEEHGSRVAGRVRGLGGAHPLSNPELVAAFLQQDKAWRTAQGYVRIADMDPTHALNAAVYILECSLQILIVLGFATAEIADERYRIEYLLSQPLVQALIARRGTSTEADLPWEKALRAIR